LSLETKLNGASATNLLSMLVVVGAPALTARQAVANSLELLLEPTILMMANPIFSISHGIVDVGGGVLAMLLITLVCDGLKPHSKRQLLL
jgi:hypothetical protein